MSIQSKTPVPKEGLRWHENRPNAPPAGYEAWHSFLRQEDRFATHEFPLYSDSPITRETPTKEGLPFQLVRAWTSYEYGHFAHVLTLRAPSYVTGPMTLAKSDTARYHGGGLPDEIAALWSLLLGVRLHAGSCNRIFTGADPHGQPLAIGAAPSISFLPNYRYGFNIPSAAEQREISDAHEALFQTYPTLPVSKSISLVRAARLYQTALQVAESEPHLTWLFFVSCVEVLASEHNVAAIKPQDALEAALPGFRERLELQGGVELVQLVATSLQRLLGSTRRFLGFLQDHLPGPPLLRSTIDPLNWDRDALMPLLTQVYNLRSRALHDGKPFPELMSMGAYSNGQYREQPEFRAAHGLDAVWLREDIPMLLHIFEHIVRGAALSWWARTAAQPALAPRILDHQVKHPLHR